MPTATSWVKPTGKIRSRRKVEKSIEKHKYKKSPGERSRGFSIGYFLKLMLYYKPLKLERFVLFYL